MKKTLSIMAGIAVALTFGVAYADQMPWDRLIENSAYLGVVSPKPDTAFTGVAAGGLRDEKMEHGYSIIDTLSPTGVVQDSGKTQLDDIAFSKVSGTKGAAPGGMRSEEHGYSIIDTLSPTGVSRDLP